MTAKTAISNKRFPIAALATLACVVTASPVFAAGGDSNPFVGTIYQSIAAVVVFLSLYLVLKTKAWGPILKGLQDREEKISTDLANAERSAKMAQDTLQEYQTKLNEAQDEARRVIEQARTDAQRVAAQLKDQTKNEIDAMRERAERDIAAAKEQAVADLHDMTAELSTAIAGRILQREINAEDQKALVDQSLQELTRSMN